MIRFKRTIGPIAGLQLFILSNVINFSFSFNYGFDRQYLQFAALAFGTRSDWDLWQTLRSSSSINSMAM